MNDRKLDEGNTPAPRWPADADLVLPEDIQDEESRPFSNWMIPSSSPEEGDRPDTRGRERSNSEQPVEEE